ncbi:chemotaxis protein CheW [Leptospira santarosai]|uniref:Chemotaxis protein CheW n=5 Tax=Leptospira santarosai TaxID=28183 RepID=M6VCT0_9LEPT|nr:chemotaxis protein CheW [Leptospira santarosai]EMO57068.1 CheW-like protein [Leptospira santarosai str. CBC1416]ASV11506.1 chemotaxis protein CheW [Leptospira santarosai]AVV80110.1 CheW-like protein [Leptospira santarosai]EKO35650.1 CheW-like protein [Leptospira santarosai str. MOR084]EKR92544.1 CheW-like protein [Leptospira santarosai str. CBC379]
MNALEENQFLTFYLGEECYGIGILHIKEIIEYSGLTNVPLMPEFIPGVINLRGNVVPVVDLKHKFFKSKIEPNRKTCVIIVEIHSERNTDRKEKTDLGILVESVNEVISIPENDIEPAPTFGSKIKVDFILGMAKQENGFIIVLNTEKILNLEELTSLEENHSEALAENV